MYLGFVAGLTALMITHQWGWVLAPILVVVFIKQQGWRPALPGLLETFILSVMIYANVLNSIDQFVSVFLITPNSTYFYPLAMNLNPFFYKLNMVKFSQPIGALLQIPLLILAFKQGHRMDALCGILAGSLTVTLLFNLGPTWSYQYLLVAFLLITGFVFRYKSHSYPVN